MGNGRLGNMYDKHVIFEMQDCILSLILDIVI